MATLPLGDFQRIDEKEPSYVWTPSKDYNLENDLQVFIDEHMMKPTPENMDNFEYHVIVTLRAYILPKVERTVEIVTTEITKVVENYTYVYNNVTYRLGFRIHLNTTTDVVPYVSSAVMKLYWKLA